jgi:hypothetical protein
MNYLYLKGKIAISSIILNSLLFIDKLKKAIS